MAAPAAPAAPGRTTAERTGPDDDGRRILAAAQSGVRTMADDRIRDASPDSVRLPPDGAGAVERDGRWRPRPWTLGVLSVLFGASLGCLMIRSSAAAWASAGLLVAACAWALVRRRDLAPPGARRDPLAPPASARRVWRWVLPLCLWCSIPILVRGALAGRAEPVVAVVYALASAAAVLALLHREARRT